MVQDRSHQRRIIWALAILTVFWACQAPKDTSVPVDLIGVWKTAAPKYEDRYFEITQDTLVFGTGSGKIDRHRIVSVEKVFEGRDLYYNISYTEGGKKSVFSFHFDPANRGVIKIKNQRGLEWMRGLER